MNRKIYFFVISGLLLVSLIFLFYYKINKKFYLELNVQVISNSIIVPIEINGKIYNFRLDTGASTSISNDLFDSLNLEIIDTITSFDYYGNSKSIKNSILTEFKIGNTIFNNLKVGIHRQIQDLAPCGIQIDGLLGGNFFKDKILLIDLKNSKLLITNRHSRLKLDRKSAIDLKLIGEQNMPELFIQFPSENAGEYVWFDTGSNNYLYRLKKSVFKEMVADGAISEDNILYDLDSEHNSSGLFGSQKDSINHVVLFDTIKIGETYLLNCTATTYENSNSKSFLGAPLLQKGIVVIDYAHEKFYFSPYKNRLIDFKPEHGCYFTYKNDKFFVEHVIPGSIADINNIKKGNTLERYNSITFDSLTICELLNLNTLMKSEENNLYVFKNNDKEIEIEINISK